MANNRLTDKASKKLVAASVETQADWLCYLKMWEAEEEECHTCQKCMNRAYCPKCFPCSLSLKGEDLSRWLREPLK